MKGINLLKKKDVASLEEIRLGKIINFATIIGIFALIFIVFLVFFFALATRDKANSLNELEKKWSENVSSYSEVESLNFVVLKKMEAIKKINAATDFYDHFSSLNSILLPDVNLRSIDLTTEGVLNIEGETSDAPSLLSFFDGLTSKMGDSLRSVMLNTLALTKDNNYIFSLTLKFSKKK